MVAHPKQQGQESAKLVQCKKLSDRFSLLWKPPRVSAQVILREGTSLKKEMKSIWTALVQVPDTMKQVMLI